MGLSSKQVSGDQGPDWGRTLLQSGAAELPKPPSIRRQQPLQQQSSEPLKCPRCASTNTKFCYYNQISASPFSANLARGTGLRVALSETFPLAVAAKHSVQDYFKSRNHHFRHRSPTPHHHAPARTPQFSLYW
ncbi:UNVERIFIED_CONTAM: hypothetical protein Slati_2002500 [Sesamum latifolium]|uniref:Dof-type domain-containing protein n=1 Tax=Sesamum latifolium TaxID=2727402 RepID=A0AAW2WMP7_9LAMI